MQFLRKAALGLAASLLFSVRLALRVRQVLGTPDTLKRALKDSGFYQTVVNDALTQAQKEQPDPQEQDNIPLDQPEVQTIIKRAASPELLQSQTEGALDSVYAWLQGKTPTLTFSADLSTFKTDLANGLGGYVEERLSALPKCSAKNPPSGDFDPFNATCLPPGTNVKKVAAEARNEILKGEFLKDTELTASDLKSEDGKPIDEQLKAVPQAYQAATWATYGAGALALLLGAAVFFLSETKRKGLKKIAIVLLSVGAVTALLGWLLGVGAGRAEQFIREGALQLSMARVGQIIVGDLRNWWLGYGIVLLVLGIGALVALHFTKPKMTAEALAKSPEPPADKPPATPPPTKPTPKPKPPKKLIQ
jgi:hypothetical protein